MLNEAYRGWSYFGYNGNRNRAFDPINENYLKIDDSYGKAGIPDAFVFVPIAEQGFSRWEAEDDVWITDTCISSSRMGTNYIGLPETGGGARAVPRIGKSTQGSFSAGVSVANGSLSTGSSESVLDFFDINGDGLPDIVRQNGSTLQVSLNLGYRFAPFENWGSAQIQESETEQAPFDLSFNPSFNIENYSFGGGASLSNSGSYVKKSLADMNGDGLVDIVRSTGSTLWVGLNTGGGFLPEVEWHGGLAAHIGDTDNVTLGGSLYTTISIYIPIPFSPGFTIILNPGGDINTSIGRSQSALRDVNGDGYTDHVASDSTSRMNVALSTIGRTNKLKQVQRPLGASFTLAYKRDGNTYEVPQCKWVLSEVTVHDGHQGDGTDTQNITFDYDHGYYDRYEREFFGYGSVTTERLNEQGAVYIAATREFLNDSYYNKGLLLKEQVADSQGNLYTVKTNQYNLINIYTGNDLIDIRPFNTIATVFPQLIRSEQYFHEGESTPGTSGIRLITTCGRKISRLPIIMTTTALL